MDEDETLPRPVGGCAAVGTILGARLVFNFIEEPARKGIRQIPLFPAETRPA
ncbi:hypothetical protein [Devosia sp. Root436]|jgi:hypothetical protein|uniref:hypothetical protein n=1 Tax=Devosia sp. Root436 TaxID=1736537 RepID=UPI000A552CBF|nr:hypothetical protein [Devosia sp. Root436]